MGTQTLRNSNGNVLKNSAGKILKANYNFGKCWPLHTSYQAKIAFTHTGTATINFWIKSDASGFGTYIGNGSIYIATVGGQQLYFTGLSGGQFRFGAVTHSTGSVIKNSATVHYFTLRLDFAAKTCSVYVRWSGGGVYESSFSFAALTLTDSVVTTQFYGASMGAYPKLDKVSVFARLPTKTELDYEYNDGMGNELLNSSALVGECTFTQAEVKDFSAAHDGTDLRPVFKSGYDAGKAFELINLPAGTAQEKASFANSRLIVW